MKHKWLALLLVTVFLAAGYLLYWYAQSPVPVGVYPGRVGGELYGQDSIRPNTYKLPVAWVRPHPWARFPQDLESASLEDDQGRGEVLQGSFRPDFSWPDQDRPVWLQPRVIFGTLALPFPKEGITATTLRWQFDGEREKRYPIGPIVLHVAHDSSPSLKVVGAAGETTPDGEIEGCYLFLEGPGIITDLVPSWAGQERPINGLRFHRGRMPSSYPKEPYLQWELIDLPLNVAGSSVIYVPLSETAQQLMRTTHFYFAPAVIYRDGQGSHTTVSSVSVGHAGNPSPGWRRWVPYFVFNEVR